MVNFILKALHCLQWRLFYCFSIYVAKSSKTGVIFLRFSGERKKVWGERGALVKSFFAPLPSCVTYASRSPGACLRSPEKRKKNNACSAGYKSQHLNNFRLC